MATPLNRWLAALAVCAGFCVLAVLWIDRPIADLLHQRVPDRYLLTHLLDAIVIPVPVCAGAVMWCGIAALRGRNASRLAESLGLAGFSVTWAVAVNELMLKPLFGRLNLNDYHRLHQYGFRLFQGSIESSFPSGHAAILLSLLSVAWMQYPRSHKACIAIAVPLLADLMAAHWHFLSDVAAGSIVGLTAGLMTVTLWRRR